MSYLSFITDEGDGTTSPLNLPQANSEHDDDESDSDFSDKGECIPKCLNENPTVLLLTKHHPCGHISPYVTSCIRKISNYFCVQKILSQ